MNKVLKNVIVIDPQSKHHKASVDIRIIDGTITEIGEAETLNSDNILKGENLHVSPGWVDMGTHPCDPGHEHKESLEALAKAASFGGFTDVLCYPNTQPAVDDASSIKALMSRAEALPSQLHFMGALTPGAKENDLAELYDMHQTGAKAFSDGRRHVQSSSLIIRSLQYMQAFSGLLLLYPDDDDLTRGAQMNEGEESVYLGMKGAPVLAETSAVARMLDLHAYAGGRLHFQPMTAASAIDAIATAKTKQTGLSTSVSIAHIAWDDSAVRSFDTHYKLTPPLRNTDQKSALIQAITEGKVDALCSFHQAQSVEEKLVEWPYAEPGMLALQTFFPLAMEHLVRPGHIDLGQLITMLTKGPRTILGLPDVRIGEGEMARLTIFDPEAEWVFDKDAVFSRAVNSPLLGSIMKGRVIN